MLLLAGRREAVWLAASPLVLAGLLVSAWLIWLNNRVQPVFWWYSDVSICSCLLATAGGALIAAQLAAGRARRDGMDQLYQSYPAPAAVRTGAQLLGVAGPVVLAVLLIGAAVAWLDSHGTLGTPRPWVLGAGLLLVVLAGTLGVALGGWLGHPMGGILVVVILGLVEVDLVLSWSNPVHLPGGIAWLFPWADPGATLAMLPGVTVPYPPPAHLAELAGLIALAAAAALLPVLRGRRAVRAVAGLAVAALAVTGLSAWSQAPGVSSGTLAALVRQATQPARYETCQRGGWVRYCYYPAFAPLVRQWAIPVNGVLTRLPPAARRGLVVWQVEDEDFLGVPLLSPTSLTSIMTVQSPLSAQLTAFQNALSAQPGLLASSHEPPVYADLTWRNGAGLGQSQFALALSTAQWATGLPTTGRWVTYHDSGGGGGTTLVSCVPVGQARESIALWLAADVSAAARAAFAASMTGSAGTTQVGRSTLATIGEIGSGPSAGLTVTVQAAELAAAMLRLPARQVGAVLSARWQHWLRPQTTSGDLAAALGLRLPAQPAAAALHPAASSGPASSAIPASMASQGPPSPVCG
jgi:hypothetical protein